jgi:hypothetical protein
VGALPRLAKATEAAANKHALRAIDDPAKLARAARIIRLALARQRLTIDDLVASPDREAAAA